MLSATIKLLFRDVHAYYQRCEQALISLGAERRCAQRLDRISERLMGMASRIDALRGRLQSGIVQEAIDADYSFRDALKSLKRDIRDIRCQLTSMHKLALPARLQRACSRLSAIAEDTYASADRLQWEIAEHDEHFVS